MSPPTCFQRSNHLQSQSACNLCCFWDCLVSNLDFSNLQRPGISLARSWRNGWWTMTPPSLVSQKLATVGGNSSFFHDFMAEKIGWQWRQWPMNHGADLIFFFGQNRTEITNFCSLDLRFGAISLFRCARLPSCCFKGLKQLVSLLTKLISFPTGSLLDLGICIEYPRSRWWPKVYSTNPSPLVIPQGHDRWEPMWCLDNFPTGYGHFWGSMSNVGGVRLFFLWFSKIF